MITYQILKRQEKQLLKITKQKPINAEQKKAIEQAKKHLVEINRYLKMFGE